MWLISWVFILDLRGGVIFFEWGTGAGRAIGIWKERFLKKFKKRGGEEITIMRKMERAGIVSEQ